MRIGSLFSGIGGLEMGLERAGLGRVVWQVEKDAYCRAVLAKHWPSAERFEDVRDFHPAGTVDVLCGGFPCQPWSVAGKQQGEADERHLWPEFARIIEEATPPLVVGENVPGLRARGLRIVLADLARLGFDAEWAMLAAGEVGAPHIRRRLFVVAAHPDRIVVRDEPGWLSRACRAAFAPIPGHALAKRGDGADTAHERRVPAWDRDADTLRVDERPAQTPDGPNADGLRRLEQALSVADERGWSGNVGWRLDQAPRVDDGFPRGPHGPARKALGNAVVPQVAEVIGRAIATAIGAA